MKGLIFQIAHGSLNDGPGIRTTVFMKGCPLNCSWCHNPESKSSRIQVFPRKQDDTSTLPQDLAHLPLNANNEHQGKEPLPLEKHHREKYQVYGDYWQADELVKFLLADRPFFEQSGGGVTFSGGEPLLQSPFIAQVLMQLKAESIHTCLDTSGFAPVAALDRVLPYTDLFLYDLKAHDDELHKTLTGKNMSLILRNLAHINEYGTEVIVRVPLVKGANLYPEFLDFLIQIKKKHAMIQQVELLKYHADYHGKPGCKDTNAGSGHFNTPEDELVQTWQQTLDAVCR